MKKYDFTLFYQTWEQCSKKQQSYFVSLFDQNEDKAKAFYHRFFLHFNILHECAHALRCAYGVRVSRYEEEQAANVFAVAFLRYMNKNDYLKRIYQDILLMLENSEKPIIEGNEISYFNQEYDVISKRPIIYGYFQLYFVQLAFEKERALSDVLYDSLGVKVQPPIQEIDDFDLHGDPKIILDVCASVLFNLGIVMPKIQLHNAYSERIQFITSNTDDE